MRWCIFFLLCMGAAYAQTITLVSVGNETPFSATVTWQTDMPSSSVVEFGPGTSYGQTSTVHSMTTSHKVTLTGLSGGTTYHFRPKSGSAIGGDGTFTTGTSRIMIKDGHYTIDGKPFIPIMQWLQAANRIPYQKNLGINVFVGQGNGESPKDYLDACADNGVYGTTDFETSVNDHQALFGWQWTDEPDLESNKILPSRVMQEYNSYKSQDPAHPFLLTVTADFFSRFEPGDWLNNSLDYYHEYAESADLVGFDHYPIYGWCQTGWIGDISDAQDEFILLAQARPTFQWIEAVKTSSQWCTGRGPYDYEIRNEVWQAIVHGAKAIGYFTHSWSCPGYTQFCLSTEQETELTRTNRQIKDLTEWILGDGFGLTAIGVDALARVHNGTVLVFAVNPTRQAKQASFSLVTGNAAVEVYEENRTLTISSGSFSDSFDALAVHIYKIGGNSTMQCTEADTNSDNSIDAAELNAYVQQWLVGSKTISKTVESILKWKSGC
jgi:hypothetical protein